MSVSVCVGVCSVPYKVVYDRSLKTNNLTFNRACAAAVAALYKHTLDEWDGE